MTAQGLVVLDHLENVEHLIKAYGFGVRYDVISKQTEWTHAQLKQIGDNAENELTSRLLGLCSMNGVPKANLATHLLAIANANSYNPVTDTLKALAWDGKPRFDAVSEAMQVSDPAIGRIAFRILPIQACAAADHGEIGMTKNADAVAHFASVIVLVGDQGIGKTRGLRRLMPSSLRAYYKESIILDLSNKDSRLQAISGWITELGELDSTFKKSDIVQLKAFLTSSEDEIRTPYAPKASKYARRCVFLVPSMTPSSCRTRLAIAASSRCQPRTRILTGRIMSWTSFGQRLGIGIAAASHGGRVKKKLELSPTIPTAIVYEARWKKRSNGLSSGGVIRTWLLAAGPPRRSLTSSTRTMVFPGTGFRSHGKLPASTLEGIG